MPSAVSSLSCFTGKKILTLLSKLKRCYEIPFRCILYNPSES
jgi:hypothetical protein